MIYVRNLQVPRVGGVWILLAAVVASGRQWLADSFERLGRLHLQGQLRPLEQTFQPAQDLRVGQGQLLERSVSHVGREVVELLVKLRRQGLLQLVVDLSMDPAEVFHRAGFGADPSGFVEDLSRHSSDPEEPLRVQAVSRSRGVVDGLRRFTGRAFSRAVHHANEITPPGQRRKPRAGPSGLWSRSRLPHTRALSTRPLEPAQKLAPSNPATFG